MQKLTSFLLGTMALLNASTILSGMCTEEKKNVATAKFMVNVYSHKLSQERLKAHIRSMHPTKGLKKELKSEHVRNAQANLEEAKREAFRAYVNLVDCFTSGTQS